MTRILLGTSAIVLLFIAAILGGSAPFGRVALSLGLPQISSLLLDDAAWRGSANFRAANFEESASDFQIAGPKQAFNRGNALVRLGRYAAALEAYDLALAHNPDDAAARSNFDLVSAFYAGTKIDPDALVKWSQDKKDGDTVAADSAQGSARAASTGVGVTNTNPLVGLPEVESRGRRSVRKVFDEKYVVATERWLATLEDVPGAYLAARIAHEHKRRAKAGEGQKEAEDPL